MALDDTIGLLAQAPIVGLLERDALRLLAFSADTRRLRAGEVLFRHGDRSDGGYVVLKGRIALAHGLAEAKAAPEVVAERGSLIGRVALFVRTTRPATAVALEASEMLRLSPTLMRRVLAEFPTAAIAIRAAMAEDLTGLMSDLDRVRASLLRPDKE